MTEADVKRTRTLMKMTDKGEIFTKKFKHILRFVIVQPIMFMIMGALCTLWFVYGIKKGVVGHE